MIRTIKKFLYVVRADAKSYLLGLTRFMHRKLLRAGVISRFDDFVWCRHQGYISKKPDDYQLHKHGQVDFEKVLSNSGCSKDDDGPGKFPGPSS